MYRHCRKLYIVIITCLNCMKNQNTWKTWCSPAAAATMGGVPIQENSKISIWTNEGTILMTLVRSPIVLGESRCIWITYLQGNGPPPESSVRDNWTIAIRATPPRPIAHIIIILLRIGTNRPTFYYYYYYNSETKLYVEIHRPVPPLPQYFLASQNSAMTIEPIGYFTYVYIYYISIRCNWLSSTTVYYKPLISIL